MTPITWQLVVNTHDGAFHLFQMDEDLEVQPSAGMLLANVQGIPNVTGEDAGFDNAVRRTLWNGKTRRLMCQLQGYRAATQTLDEVKEELHDWTYISKLSGVQETDPEDILNDGLS